MLNVRSKTALAVLALALCLMSLMLLVTLFFTIPGYQELVAKGPQLLSTPKRFLNLLEIYRMLFFVLLPSIALLCGAGSWIAIAHVRKPEN
jgi:hypothetical protein